MTCESGKELPLARYSYDLQIHDKSIPLPLSLKRLGHNQRKPVLWQAGTDGQVMKL